MAPDTENNTSEVKVKTGLFDFSIAGANAFFIFLFVAILADTGLTYLAHQQRQQEHMQLMCAIKLNLFMQNQARGTIPDWERMPVDLYGCIPKFLYERQNRGTP